jgi:hypothetical protein
MDKFENQAEFKDIFYTYREESSTQDLFNRDYDLLIITDDDLKPAFQPLAADHNADGVRTIIRTLTNIGSTDPVDIREYILNEYLNHNISYVLIGGDHDVVPSKELYYGKYYYWEQWLDMYGPSDLYYSCLDGDFNGNGNGIFGEPDDNVDLVAEVYIGRACVGDIPEVNHFVNKTLAYKNGDPRDPYLNKVLMAGEWLVGPPDYPNDIWGGDYMDELINGSDSNDYVTVGIPNDEDSLWDIDKLYDRDWSGHYWPNTEIKNRINNNLHIINHLGHGNEEYALKMYIQEV